MKITQSKSHSCALSVLTDDTDCWLLIDAVILHIIRVCVVSALSMFAYLCIYLFVKTFNPLTPTVAIWVQL